MRHSIRSLFDLDEVRRALIILVEPKSVFEVRALDAKLSGNHRCGTVSGYFDNAEECVKQLSRLMSARGIYITLNPLDPALLARRANRLDYAGKDGTTSDQHVLTRRWLLIDVDADRPSGISATDAEKEAAHVKSREIYRYLKNRGWPNPVVCDSGNGFHLLFRVKLPPADERLIERLLTALANYFDRNGVKIDRAVHNPARIARLYGTVAAKGDNTKDRPHRLSKIITALSLVALTKEESIQKVLADLEAQVTPKVNERRRIADRNSNPDKAQIREMLAVIPKRPEYPDWIKIVAAVGDALPNDEAIELLNEWSPEERKGEYEEKLRHRLEDVRIGTLIYLARMHGWTPKIDSEEKRPNLWQGPEIESPTLDKTEEVELPQTPAPYVPPPLALLPSKLQDYVLAAAESLNVDVAFILLPQLSSLGAAIGNARSIVLKRRFIQPPIIWTGIIGRSGSRKSPGMEAGCWPVMEHERELDRQNKQEREQFENVLADWNSKARKQRGVEPEPPALLTCMMDDLTLAVLADNLEANPRGLLIAKDELSHWFASFDQFHQAKGADVARWLSLHTGVKFLFDRRGDSRGDKRAYRIWDPRVCITGGIQPKILRRVLTPEFFERGLPARFLLAFPPMRQDKWSDKTVADNLCEAVLELFDELWLLQPEHDDHGQPWPKQLSLDADAKSVFVDFYNACGTASVEAGEHEEAAWNKLTGYGARLALVGQLARNPVAEIVTGEVMQAACELARWFGNEAVRIYAELAETRDQRDQRELCEWVEQRGGTATLRDTITYYWPLKNQSDKAQRMYDQLVRSGRGKWEDVKPSGRGRPTRIFQLLHTSASAKIPEIRGKRTNCADAEAPNTQKITPIVEPDKKAVSGDLDAVPAGDFRAMTAKPIAVFQEAAKRGLMLGIRPPDRLTVQPAERCPPDFADTLRAYQRHLLTMLRWPFVMVYSQALGETVFFCEDEDTRAALIDAGASEWSIYTKAELRTLIAQNRVAPLSAAELRKLHEIKRTFNARTTS